ncbi:unnamed protein product [Microthlaspi erraticum]|uniref:Histone deacetylase interacting domain-containing protein n=1 Tax=Microthlaspi erraticum TaxID=1685480 RepID=A0A6D2JZ93_9BRAS|nr:unnamed protein product [Microthlaspi erraticum]
MPMLPRNVLELWSSFNEKLTPTDMKKMTSLLVDFTHRRINKTQAIKSALLLLERDEFLYPRFADFLRGIEPREDDEDRHTRDGDEASSLEEGEIRKDHLRDGEGETDEVSGLEEGEIRRDHHLRDQEIEDDVKNLGIVVDVDEKLKEDSFTKLENIDLERKKRKQRGILHKESQQIESSPKKTRTSTKGLERLNPSYRCIPKEEQSPVSDDTVLNNKYKSVSQKKDDNVVWKSKKLNEYEVAMARCEEDMYKVDMWMRCLRDAVEIAEKAMREDKGLEGVGGKFYRTVEQIYGRHGLEVTEVVRRNHKKALPVILPRLEQMLSELIVAQERWTPIWKQAFEKNTAKQKQRDSRRKK